MHVWVPLVLAAASLSAGCAKWRSPEEFDTEVLKRHSVVRIETYDLDEAKEVAGAYLAELARDRRLDPPDESRFSPYPICLGPELAKQPFRFLDSSFAPGWVNAGAQLVVEMKDGTRLKFCFDNMVVNLSRFPCFECPGGKYLHLPVINGMRAACEEPPLEPRGEYFRTTPDDPALAALQACHVAPGAR